jgi:hypothetical protein
MVEARVYLAQKDYEHAEPYFLRAVNIDQALYGTDNIGLLIPLSGLCGIYDMWNKPDKSAPCDKRLLTVLEKQYGTTSPVIVSTLVSEAKALRSLGRADEAAAVQKRIDSIQTSAATKLN